MVYRLITKQVGKKLDQDGALSFPKPKSFQCILDALDEGRPIAPEFVRMLDDFVYLGTNLFLLEQLSDEILLYLDDEGRSLVLDALHRLYMGKSVSGRNDKILELFILISSSISSVGMRKKYAALSTHMLAENPCDTDLKDKVEALLEKDIPDFRF